MSTAKKGALPADEFASFHAAYAKTARRIACREHRGSSLYEVADIEQAIWERVIVNWKYYCKSDSRYVEIFMTRSARGFASAQRIDHMCASGAFIYTPRLIMSNLESCALDSAAQALGANVPADFVDAFEKLRIGAPSQAAAVFKRYGTGAAVLSPNDRANCSRGVASMTHHLNGRLNLQAEAIDIAVAEEA